MYLTIFPNTHAHYERIGKTVGICLLDHCHCKQCLPQSIELLRDLGFLCSYAEMAISYLGTVLSLAQLFQHRHLCGTDFRTLC